MGALPLSGPSPVLVRYRNRELREGDLEFIRGVLARDGALSRREISRNICRAWDWRQPNGGWSEYACRDLLLRLEEWGHVKLPPRCRADNSRRRLPLLPPELVPLSWLPLEPGAADLRSLVVRPVQPEERQGWRLYMERFHYLGARPLVGEHLLYAAFLEDELVALLAWAAAAFRCEPREQFVGWDEGTKRRRLHLIANNARFLVLRSARLPHLASKVLGRNLRRLSADWQRAWGHPLYLAETFVDAARFRGTCYRASNWRFLGMTRGCSKRGNTYRIHGAVKSVFVYPLHRRAREILRGDQEGIA